MYIYAFYSHIYSSFSPIFRVVFVVIYFNLPFLTYSKKNAFFMLHIYSACAIIPIFYV